MIKTLLTTGAVVHFDYKHLLDLSYEKASRILRDQVSVYLLDRKSFEESKEAVMKLLEQAS